VDSIIEDNLIVNVLNEAFHAQANTLRLQGGLDHQGHIWGGGTSRSGCEPAQWFNNQKKVFLLDISKVSAISQKTIIYKIYQTCLSHNLALQMCILSKEYKSVYLNGIILNMLNFNASYINYIFNQFENIYWDAIEIFKSHLKVSKSMQQYILFTQYNEFFPFVTAYF